VLATAASATTATLAGSNSPGALAAGYDQVFLIAAALGLAIAAVSLLLRAPEPQPTTMPNAAIDMRQHHSGPRSGAADCCQMS
jgi:hypothetical protein